MTMWIKDGARAPSSISYIWNGLMKIKKWLIGNLQREIGSSTKVEIVLDPIKGFIRNHTAIYYINQIQVVIVPNFLYLIWISSKDLGIYGALAKDWDRYIHNLLMVGITLREMRINSHGKGRLNKGQTLVKYAYKYITRCSEMGKKWMFQ